MATATRRSGGKASAKRSSGAGNGRGGSARAGGASARRGKSTGRAGGGGGAKSQSARGGNRGGTSARRAAGGSGSSKSRSGSSKAGTRSAGGRSDQSRSTARGAARASGRSSGGGARKSSGSGGRSRAGGGSSSRASVDHDEIRQWAEERGGQPSCVRGTGGGGDIGMLRIDFPGFSGEGSLEPISWDDFFEKFDERGLALIFQDTTRGQKSNFNKLVSRDDAKVRKQLQGTAAAGKGR